MRPNPRSPRRSSGAPGRTATRARGRPRARGTGRASLWTPACPRACRSPSTSPASPPSSRFRHPGTVLGAQEIFTTVNPYGNYFLGPDNIPGGRNRARRLWPRARLHQRRAPGLLQPRGRDRARSHSCFALPLTHFIPDSLTYSVPLLLNRQCDRTLGRELREPPRRREPVPPSGVQKLFWAPRNINSRGLPMLMARNTVALRG
jgi:hypothetical protein